MVVGAWITFGNEQTGQLEKANGRYADGMGIVRRCEQRDAEVTRRVNRKWFEFWK